MEQPLAVDAENSRAKVQNVGGDSSAGIYRRAGEAANRPCVSFAELATAWSIPARAWRSPSHLSVQA